MIVNATQRDATRREIAAGGLVGARREGRSEAGARRARLRLRLPSRRIARARRAADRRCASAVRLFRGPVSILPLVLVSSRRSRPFFASAIGSRPVLSLVPFFVSAARNRDRFTCGERSEVRRVTRRSSNSEDLRNSKVTIRLFYFYFSFFFLFFFNRWHANAKRSSQRVSLSRSARMFRYCWIMSKFAWLRQAKGHRARIVTERYA